MSVGGTSLDYPGLFASMSETPSVRLPRTRLALTIASLVAVAAACSSSASGSTASTSFSTIAPTTSTTTTVAKTTTTVAETTTTEEVTTTTAAPAPVYPLTGLPAVDPAIAGRPALVVKIDNATGARPQTGFNAADIVFEEIVNDNLTRFALVFQSGGSDPVGPIRSGRLQDIDLFSAYGHPLFAWSGGNRTVTDAIHQSALIDIGPSVARVYYRSGDRSAPHNLYSNTSALYTMTPFGAGPPQQQFQYRSPEEPVAGVPARGVGIALDSINAEWEWSPEGGVYVRTMEGRPHNDAGSRRIDTNNVVVLAVDYASGVSGSPDAQTVGTGEAFVFTGGNYVHGTWSRGANTEPFVLTADDGSPIELTPGRTFVELPRNGSTLPILG